MNFIPFSRWNGNEHADAAAIVSRIGHLVKIGSTASSLNDKDHPVVLTGISAMAGLGLIEPHRKDITLATHFGNHVYKGWTICGKINKDCIFTNGSLKLKSENGDGIDVWLSDYGDSEFQTHSGHALKTTFKMDVEALGINLAILHPVEILKLYLNGCFQSNIEERYADYLIGVLTRHCHAEGVLNQVYDRPKRCCIRGPIIM